MNKSKRKSKLPGKSMIAAFDKRFKAVKVRTCRVCGCTDDDCRQCIEKTGQPCYWVQLDLCSACFVPDDKLVVEELVANLHAEIGRLRAGRFTPEEFQNLCHKLTMDDGANKFCLGCEEYQHRLFGYSPITTLKHENHTMREQQQEMLNALTCVINWWRTKPKKRVSPKKLVVTFTQIGDPEWFDQAHRAISNLQWPKVPV